jgi:ComF family protein
MERLFYGRVPLSSASAFLQFKKAGLTQHLMHQLKYKGDETIGEELGRLFGVFLLSQSGWQKPEALACVPLHKSKELKRGYNQSAAIGRGLALALGIPFFPKMIIKPEQVSSQTLKKRYERWENMRSGFIVETSICNGFNHIGIVDDVVTTGATLEACAHVLRLSGCSQISLFTLCISIK